MSDIAAKIVDAIFDQWSVDGGLTKSKAVERVTEVLAAAKQQAKPKPTVKVLTGERYPYERSMVDTLSEQFRRQEYQVAKTMLFGKFEAKLDARLRADEAMLTSNVDPALIEKGPIKDRVEVNPIGPMVAEAMDRLRDRQIEQLISPYGVHPESDRYYETQTGPVCSCATCTSFRNMQGRYRD